MLVVLVIVCVLVDSSAEEKSAKSGVTSFCTITRILLLASAVRGSLELCGETTAASVLTASARVRPSAGAGCRLSSAGPRRAGNRR